VVGGSVKEAVYRHSSKDSGAPKSASVAEDGEIWTSSHNKGRRQTLVMDLDAEPQIINLDRKRRKSTKIHPSPGL
jgi:hypothetical protein